LMLGPVRFSTDLLNVAVRVNAIIPSP
jgi:hypothetical protein